MKIIVDTFIGDGKINSMMHACDVFENGKQLATYSQVAVTGNDSIKLDELVDNLKNAYEQAGSNVVFINIRSIDGKFNSKYTPYIKHNVQTISTGNEYGLFDDMLRVVGYDVTTDEHRHVLTAVLDIPIN